MQSTFFPDAHDFSISHSSFNHVQGDQHNNNNLRISKMSAGGAATDTGSHGVTTQGTMITTVHGNQFNQIVQQEEKGPTEFEDFRIVKRGDICRDQDVVQFVLNDYQCHRWYPEDCQCKSCQGQVIKTVCIGKIEGTRGKFTVMSYSGPGGRKAFEKDFRKYSSVVSSRVLQMYAVDIGSIPSILYWNELVPAVVLKGNLGWMGRMYLYSLYKKWGNCTQRELWMDSARGVICRGLEGPDPYLWGGTIDIEDIPSTVDLLQDDIWLRFMASCKSKEVDHGFVEGIRLAGSDVVVPELFDQPTVISALTQTPIAVAKNIWESQYNDNLVERKVLESRLTRFRVVGDGLFFLWLNLNVESAWLCQALGLFHARGIGLDDNLSVDRLVRHVACLRGHLSRNQNHCQQRSQQSIYLFVHPPPPNQPWGQTSSLHFWSAYEDGQKPLPPDICDDFGLPTMLEYKDWGYESRYWLIKSYRQLDEYQRLRGFDLTTTDFVRHLGYDGNIFSSVNDTDRLHEDREDQHIECRQSLDLDHGQNNVDNDASEACGDTLFNPVGEPTPTHVVANGGTNAEEESIDCCCYTDQNLHSPNDDIFDVHTVEEPSIQRTSSYSRRSTPNYNPAHTGYPPNTASLPHHRTASTDLYESHRNSSFPSSPEVLHTTNHLFSVFDGLMNAASTTSQTEGTAGQSLEMPWHTVLPVPSHGLTSPWPHRNAYAGAAVTNGFPHFTPTPTSSLSSPSNIYAVGHPMPIPGEHSPQRVGSSGMPQFGRSAQHHYRPSSITSLDAFPMSTYAPAVGYPTNTLMGGILSELQTANHAYRSMPYAAPSCFCDSAPLVHNYNTTVTGVNDMARYVGTRSEDERATHFDTLISGTSNYHLPHNREFGSMAVLGTTDSNVYQSLLSSGQPNIDELCVQFERLAIV
ncbi:hypothetical protein PQX77_017635 [Marasmius sp. AFHP31]|nr:hypothetical protein PQX77_017635 [Marasmius sp. AFHP31]